jgi:hypothetical protein
MAPLYRVLVSCASLHRHVSRVVLLGSKEQMVWVAAWAVVAVMTDAHAVGDFSVDQRPRNTVNIELLAVNLDDAVSGVLGVAGPNPAVSRLVEFRVKTFSNGLYAAACKVSDALPAATLSVFSLIRLKLTLGHREEFAANITGDKITGSHVGLLERSSWSEPVQRSSAVRLASFYAPTSTPASKSRDRQRSERKPFKVKHEPYLVVGHGVCWWQHADGSMEIGPDRSGVFFAGPRQNWWSDGRQKGKQK